MNKKKATLYKNANHDGSKDGKQASVKSDGYTFTPQDLKYDNKHYKYFIYSKPNKVVARRNYSKCPYINLSSSRIIICTWTINRRRITKC